MFIRKMLQSDFWIMERGPSIHFRIDGSDHLYAFSIKVKTQDFKKVAEKL